MTKLNMNISKDRPIRILISSMQTVRDMDLGSTTTTEIDQTTKTATDVDPFYIKDQLDFQIAMIESLAG